MELVAFLRFLRAYARAIVATVVAAALTAGVVSLVLPPTYEAEARLVIGPSLTGRVTDYNQLLSAQALSRTYAEAARTNALAERMTSQLGLDETPADFLERVTTSTARDSAILTIAAQDDTAEGAAIIANAIAQDLITESAAIQGRDAEIIELLDDQMEAVEDQITTAQDQLTELSQVEDPTGAQIAQATVLQERLSALRATLANLLSTAAQSRSNAVSFLDPAVPPEGPVSPRPLVNIIIAVVLGLLAGLALAALLAALDDTVKGGDDLRALVLAPVLGVIGNIPAPRGARPLYRLAMLTQPRSRAAESIRAVRTNIDYAKRDEKLQSLLVTSASTGDGKSIVAANLAIAFAQAGRRTILVDADLRQPSVHELFELDNSQGLTSVLRSGASELEATLRTSEVADLSILTSGPPSPNPAELLDSPRIAVALEELLRSADLVIIDSPPVTSVTDAVLLSARVDGTLLVTAAGKTRRGSLRATEEALRRVGAHVVGTVLNTPAGAARNQDEPDSYPYAESVRGENTVRTGS